LKSERSEFHLAVLGGFTDNAGHSRSEWRGVFEGPSASLLVSGHAKTPPDRASVVPALASAVSVLSVSSVFISGSAFPDGENILSFSRMLE
jgi:hypothetical protein